MKNLIYILILLMGCTKQNTNLTYEVYSNRSNFEVSYTNYNGDLVTVEIRDPQWKKTFAADRGDHIELIVKADSIQIIQAKITFDSVLLIEETEFDTLPEIKLKLTL